MDALRAYIRSILLEEDEEDGILVEPGSYGPMNKMALLVDSARHNTVYVLYNPDYFSKRIRGEVEKARKDYGDIRFKEDNKNDFDGFYSFANIRDLLRNPMGVYGFMQVLTGRQLGIQGSCNKANEITHLSARKKYSTFMYEIALLRHSPIMPARDYVSDNAKKMWSYFFKDRPDVEKLPFKDEMGLHKKGEEDCKVYKYKPLDQAYKSKEHHHIENLKNKHDLFLGQLHGYLEQNEVDFIKTRVTQYLLDAGKIFYENDIVGWGTEARTSRESSV